MQDPVNRLIVYAGTTEGLYETTDGGTAWSRLTGPDVIINDVFVDPKNDQHVLLATDRSGVLASEDGGRTFQDSNSGFSQRQVESVLLDQKAPATIYAGVLNDKMYGGVFVSEDGGNRWQQRSDGLEGRDVYTLAQADDGTVFAGTSHGIFRWDGSKWQRDGQLVIVTEKPVRMRISSRRTGKLASAESRPAPTASTASATSAASPESAKPATGSAASGWTAVYEPVGKGPAKGKAHAAAKSASKSTAKSAAKSTRSQPPVPLPTR